MEKNITLGIDLGTTYSAVAYVDEHGDPQIIVNNMDNHRITPSVVWFEKEDSQLVGNIAKENLEMLPNSVVAFVKREMGKNKDEVRKEENFGTPKPYDFFGKRYAPEEISSIILKKLKGMAEHQFKGQEISDVVITVPAYFNDSEKKATKDAGEMAGFNVLQVINEPTAAAISYGVAQKTIKSEKVFVFDLGGGTFDVTVLDIVNNNGSKEINIINTDGDHRLGGKDWDDKIIEFVAQEFISKYGEDPRDNQDAMAVLRGKSETVKMALSQRDSARIQVATNNNLQIEISKSKFEEITAGLMSRIEGLCDSVLNKSNLKWSDIDTILLAGGSTRMPMIQELLKKISGKEIRTDLVNPDECVAFGAALHSTIVKLQIEPTISVSQEVRDKLGSVRVNDITSHTLGIVAYDRDGNPKVSQMIMKGTKIPFNYTEEFETASDNQPNLLFEIKEGESVNPQNVPTIQEATFPIANPIPAGSPIEVTFDLSADGSLTVIGKDLINKKEISVKVERSSNMSNTEIESGRNHLRGISVS